MARRSAFREDAAYTGFPLLSHEIPAAQFSPNQNFANARYSCKLIFARLLTPALKIGYEENGLAL